MINVTTEDNKTFARIEGDALDVIPEAVHAVAACADVIAKHTNCPLEAALYALIMSAIRRLEKDGHSVNKNEIGMAIILPFDETESAPWEAATSTGAQEL